MNYLLKKQINTYLKDYIEQKFNIQVNKKYFECPFKNEHDTDIAYPTANISMNNVLFCSHPSHGKIGNLIDLVRKTEEGMQELNDNDIIEYLIDLFDIQTDNKTEDLLNFYKQLQFDLVPIIRDGKAPIESEWQKNSHKDKNEWIEWLKAGSNIGVKTGKLSNILVIDIDNKPIPETLKNLLDKYPTLIQETPKGYHYIYKYDNDILKTCFDFEDTHIDIQGEGGQIVIEPSIVGEKTRKWLNKNEIIELPKEIKEFILLNSKAKKINKTNEPNIKTDFELTFENLNHNRNNTFIKLGGELRKKMNVGQTSYAMYLFNQLLDKQLPQKELNAMLREIEKYHSIDMEELANQVIERLEKIEEATIRDLTYSLRQEQKDIEDVLRYLVDKNIVYKKSTKYKLFQRAEWKENFIAESKLLKYKVPYFDDYAVLRNGDMIIIGAKTGQGKTHLAVNMIKKFAEQGIKTDYISSEPGNRFTKIALALGLKEGEFRWCNNYRPERLELEDNGATIVDWLLPENYAETDKLYQKFAQQLDKHGGLLIIFTQLKSDGTFFAQNMVDFFASLSCKYCQTPIKDKQGNTTYDNENTYFETIKIRESKSGRQHITIPTFYNTQNKTLELRK